MRIEPGSPATVPTADLTQHRCGPMLLLATGGRAGASAGVSGDLVAESAGDAAEVVVGGDRLGFGSRHKGRR